MAKVVHLTSVHRAHDTRIFHKQCRSLATAGYDVTLVVPSERAEIRSGVRIQPVAPCRGRLDRVTRTMKAVYQTALAQRADLYHFHDPELIAVGLLLKLRGKRVIYDVHEDFPKDVLSKHWMPKWVSRIVAPTGACVEEVLARFLDAIVVATPGISVRFPRKKTIIVRNYPIYDASTPENSAWTNATRTAAYVGGITLNRGLREMMAAVSQVSQDLDVRLALVGSFSPPHLVDEIQSMEGSNRTDCLGWCDQKQVREILSRTNVGLSTLLPTKAFVDALPTKLFEYMAAGVPVVVSDFPICREIVSSSQCGILVNPERPDEIADAIGWLLNNPAKAQEMGRRGKAAIRSEYNWDRAAAGLLDLYANLIGPPVGVNACAA